MTVKKSCIYVSVEGNTMMQTEPPSCYHHEFREQPQLSQLIPLVLEVQSLSAPNSGPFVGIEENSLSSRHSGR
jgi:hypothetical protein